MYYEMIFRCLWRFCHITRTYPIENLAFRPKDTIVAVRDIIAERHVPPPVNDKRCEDCSLREACLPHVSGNLAKNRRAAKEVFERGDW
jgi:CRISPR-associated exonuclease Cas4